MKWNYEYLKKKLVDDPKLKLKYPIETPIHKLIFKLDKK